MRIPESELVINGDGTVFHLHMRPEQLADNVILVGDRARVDVFRPYFDTVESETSSREFVSVTGVCRGRRFTVLSTGIGMGSIDIVMNELDILANIDLDAREPRDEHRTLRILRVGTSGAIQPDIPIGGYVFSEYSIGMDGILNWYAGRSKVVDEEASRALAAHAHITGDIVNPYVVKASGKLASLFVDKAFMGMTVSAPGFYGPQGRSVRLPLALGSMVEDFESFSYRGRRILNFEMESSVIAGLGRQLGHEAGTICMILANRYRKSMNTDYKSMMDGFVSMVMDTLTGE